MKKALNFFKNASPLKLILIALVLTGATYFIEKPLPNVFLFFRLIALVLFIYAVIKFSNSKILK